MKIGILVSGVLLLPTSAAAQRGRRAHEIQGVRPEVHGTLGWGLGVGGRVDIPILPDGFLNSQRDELVISPGFEFLFAEFADRRDCYWVGGTYRCYGQSHSVDFVVSILTVAQWNIYVGDWSFFPEAGLALSIGENYAYHNERHDPWMADHLHFYLEFVLGGGARWHFGDRMSLVVRLVWPYGAQVGVTF